MTTVRTNLGTHEAARSDRFEPTGTISATNVQQAIEEVAAEAVAGVGDMTKATYDANNDGKIDVGAGGTGFSSYTTGDLLYASSATVLAKLADIAAGNALISGGVGAAPAWGKIGLTTHVSGTLAAGNGGTGLASYAVGDILYADTASTLAKLAGVVTGNALISGGTNTAPAWGKIGLTTHISGVLPVANGGTNASSASGTALDNITGFSSTGMMARTGSGAYSFRTLTGTSNKITVTNGDGFSGNPTITVGTDILQVGKHSIWIPAGAMTARTTSGAASGTVEMTTNKNMVRTLDFDASTQEFAQFDIRMPKSWDESTVTFIPVWSHTATATNFGVVWGLDAVAISDDDTLDAAFGTAQTSTDTGGTTNDLYQGPESSAITIAGSPAEADYVMFRIHRDPSNGSDTMAIDARLHGILLLYTLNAANDA